MLLTLEKGVLGDLRRLLHVDVQGTSAADHDRDGPSRESLIFYAAHTVLPEAAEESLPGIARAELTAGLGGPLREAIAQTDSNDPALPGLRDQLVTHLGGQPGRLGAILVADHVPLARLVRGDAPAIVAVGCLFWYGSYRSDSDPHTDLVRALQELHDTWLSRPGDQPATERAMVELAISVAGERPADPLDVTV